MNCALAALDKECLQGAGSYFASMSPTGDSKYRKELEALDFTELEASLQGLCARGDAEELLRQQIAEIDLLSAMFPGDGEFTPDEAALTEARNYLLGTDGPSPPPLSLELRLTFPSISTAELTVDLPRDYPLVEPEVFVRAEKLDRLNQRRLNDDLSMYVKSLDRGDTCLYTVVSWLQDNVEKYRSEKIAEQETKKIKVETFARLWIYSHHIYSKTKRRNILSTAEDCKLTGFTLPGKPGIICIEGESSNCDDWWANIKSMNWKKIVVKKREDFLTSDDFVPKFNSFEEISFQSSTNRGTDHHMDMGEFYKYLTDHDCGYIFMDYFGINGRIS